MRGIGDKSPLRVERALQPLQQPVDGVAEFLQFVVGAGHGQPLVQAVRGDSLGRGRHLPERARYPARDDPPQQQRCHCHDAQGYCRADQQIVRYAIACLARCGLEKAARRRAGGYSLGMRQRLGIAAAMRGDLAALAAQGRAVLVSSHLMSELEDTADHLVVVGRGRVIADISMAELIAAASGGRVLVRTTERPTALTVLEDAGATVTATSDDTLTVAGLGAERIVAVLTENAVPFSEVAAHRATLEQAYMDLTSDVVEYRAEPASLPASAKGAGR